MVEMQGGGRGIQASQAQCRKVAVFRPFNVSTMSALRVVKIDPRFQHSTKHYALADLRVT